jgi:hypothetical protein
LTGSSIVEKTYKKGYPSNQKEPSGDFSGNKSHNDTKATAHVMKSEGENERHVALASTPEQQ